MKSLTLVLFFLSSFILKAQIPFDSVGFKYVEIGSIEKKGGSYIIMVKKQGFEEHYLPLELPEAYRSQGMEVAFSGALGAIPPNVRLAGTPIKLHMIRKLYRVDEPRDEMPPAVPAEEARGDSLSDETGLIRKLDESDVYVIQVDKGPVVITYFPEFLPEDFQVDGMKVEFSGTTREVDDRKTDYPGIPLNITEMLEIIADPNSGQAGGQAVQNNDDSIITDMEAIVRLFDENSDLYILEVFEPEYTRYLPENLPDEFKRDALKVIVSGEIGEIPPNVRLVGTPFVIKDIRKKN